VKKEELFKKLKTAIDNEYDAYLMYKDIAERSGDAELRVIFNRIAGEEYNHWETIQKRYNILTQLAEE